MSSGNWRPTWPHGDELYVTRVSVYTPGFELPTYKRDYVRGIRWPNPQTFVCADDPGAEYDTITRASGSIRRTISPPDVIVCHTVGGAERALWHPARPLRLNVPLLDPHVRDGVVAQWQVLAVSRALRRRELACLLSPTGDSTYCAYDRDHCIVWLELDGLCVSVDARGTMPWGRCRYFNGARRHRYAQHTVMFELWPQGRRRGRRREQLYRGGMHRRRRYAMWDPETRCTTIWRTLNSRPHSCPQNYGSCMFAIASHDGIGEINLVMKYEHIPEAVWRPIAPHTVYT